MGPKGTVCQRTDPHGKGQFVGKVSSDQLVSSIGNNGNISGVTQSYTIEAAAMRPFALSTAATCEL